MVILQIYPKKFFCQDEEEKPSTNDMSASEICRYFNEKVPNATTLACLRSLILRTSVVPDLDDLYWKSHEDGVHQELWIGDDWFNWSEERHLECGYDTEKKKKLWTEIGVSKGQGRSQAKSTNPEVLEAIYLLTQGKSLQHIKTYIRINLLSGTS